MAAKKEVALQGNSSEVATTQQLPAFMQGMAGAGTEQMSTSDVEVPRLVLLQALSPEVQNGDEKPNHFWHTVAEVNLGQEVRIIPVWVNQSFMLWKPRKMGGGILARADDAIHWNPPNGEFEVQPDGSNRKVVWRTANTVRESGLDQWGSSDPDNPNSQPAATRMYNIAAVLPDYPEYSPVVITLQRSAVKVARKFVGKLMLSQAPSFGLVFKMHGVKDQNSSAQEFFNFRFIADGLVTDEATFNQTKAMYEHFKAVGIRVKDEEKMQEEVVGDDAAAADETKEPAY